MPENELLDIQPIRLRIPVQQIVSHPGVRVNCGQCGEEIINEREILSDGQILCHACALGGYYHPQEELQLPLYLSGQSVSY